MRRLQLAALAAFLAAAVPLAARAQTPVWLSSPTGTPYSATNPLPVTGTGGGGGATAANQANTAPGVSATTGQGVQGVTGGVPLPASQSGTWTVQPGNTANTTPWLVSSKPAALTIVPLDIASVTTGGTAVVALSAGHASAGGFIITANAAGICVDQQTTAGVATGTPSSTICQAANVPFQLVPNAHAVSVNSSANTVSLAGEGLQ